MIGGTSLWNTSGSWLPILIKFFRWNIRKRGDGSTYFDDAVGEVSGTWAVGRPPPGAPGLLVYIMVDIGRRGTKSIV